MQVHASIDAGQLTWLTEYAPDEATVIYQNRHTFDATDLSAAKAKARSTLDALKALIDADARKRAGG